MRRLVLYGGSSLFFFYSFFLFGFFLLQEKIKPVAINGFESFVLYLFNLFLTCLFYYVFLRIFNNKINYSTVVSVYSATLLPTILFFYSNLFFYFLLPPPRTLSLLGIIFSYLYLSWVSALVFWKISLLYLCLRFLGRLDLFKVVFLIVLYTAVFSLYFLLLYQLQLIRLPII
ncbi:MAG: hypothetical protein KatS3mg091_727 [Patescibacteria group bacterium]|nr:MAG: hypothetical protein KatS3mg091_727 [Patescibacteria group bacterium]